MSSTRDKLSKNYGAKPDGYYDTPRPEMLQFVPLERKRILEVGCGVGTFGKQLKERSSEVKVWGIEPDSSSADAAEKVLDRVIRGVFEVETPELAGERFDCIVFNDVLEHMTDPDVALLAAKQHLTADGLVIASIPNILYFPTFYMIVKTQDWRYEDKGILDNTHLRFFTRKSIERLFKDSGYDVIRIGGINRYTYWKFNVLNFFLLNRINDFRYGQFAIVARVAR
jgi:2-polyprenyl-3-methyl-5-hydroxy-6-metoxy-1,4-benzoquinol methylase